MMIEKHELIYSPIACCSCGEWRYRGKVDPIMEALSFGHHKRNTTEFKLNQFFTNKFANVEAAEVPSGDEIMKNVVRVSKWMKKHKEEIDAYNNLLDATLKYHEIVRRKNEQIEDARQG